MTNRFSNRLNRDSEDLFVDTRMSFGDHIEDLHAMTHHTLHTAIPVLLTLDIPATVGFYTRKLGFSCRHEQSGFAVLQRDDVVLHFTRCPDRRLVEWSCCRVSVTGVDALYQEFASQGVSHPSPHGKPHDTDHGTREFGVIDCQGVLITFFEMRSNEDLCSNLGDTR